MFRLPLVVYATLVALAFSQVPVFVQEYEQRLGGALDELARVIERDVANARAMNLDLNTFLQKHELSGDEAFQRTGQAMRDRLVRRDALAAQAAALDAAPIWKKPLLVGQNADRDILTRTWEKFHPTLTLDPMFGGVGLIVALLLRDLTVWLGRLVFGRRKPTGRLPR